jgi:hypothetical protein
MADFLTRLAERTLGVPPAIRPDIAPSWVPAPSEEAWSRPGPKVEASVSAVATVPNGPSNTVARIPVAEQHAPDRTVPVEAKSEPHPPEPVVVSAYPRQSSPHESGTVRPIFSSHAEAQPSLWSKEPSPSQRISAAPASPRVALPSLPKIVPRATVPIVEMTERVRSDRAVQVTIGSVEVRAIVSPPAPAQRVAERRIAPNLRLDEYLKERNQGRR